MDDNGKAVIGAAVIVAVAVILAGFLAGGRYSFIRIGESTCARCDRWSGHVDYLRESWGETLRELATTHKKNK